MNTIHPVIWPDNGRPATRKFRIISFDGGPSALANLAFLREAVAWREVELTQSGETEPVFWNVIGLADVIAGTSGGAVIACWFASHMKEIREAGPERVLEIVDEAIVFAREMYFRLEPNFRGKFRMLTGRSALTLNGGGTRKPTLWNRITGDWKQPFPEWLNEQFEGQHLHDVPLRLVIPAFQMGLNDQKSGPLGSKLFHNLVPNASCAFLSDTPSDIGALFAHGGGCDDGTFTDPNPRLADVAAWSGAFPMAYPVLDGHVDGAFVANNPSAAAVALGREALRWDHAEVLHTGSPAQPPREGPPPDDEHHHQLDDFRVMSFGSVDMRLAHGLIGKLARHQGGNVEWGYGAWALNIMDPLLLLGALLGGQVRSENLLTNLIVGSANVLRVATTPGLALVSLLVRYLLLPSDKLWEEAVRGGKYWAIAGATQLSQDARRRAAEAANADPPDNDEFARLAKVSKAWLDESARLINELEGEDVNSDDLVRKLRAGENPVEMGWIADFRFTRDWLYSRWLINADYDAPDPFTNLGD